MLFGIFHFQTVVHRLAGYRIEYRAHGDESGEAYRLGRLCRLPVKKFI